MLGCLALHSSSCLDLGSWVGCTLEVVATGRGCCAVSKGNAKNKRAILHCSRYFSSALES